MDKIISHDKKVKLSLVQATNSVRNKFNALRNEDLETDRLLEEQFKPITQRLTKVINNTSRDAVKKRDDDNDGAATSNVDTRDFDDAEKKLNDEIVDDYNDVDNRKKKKSTKVIIKRKNGSVTKKKNVVKINRNAMIQAEMRRELLNLKSSNINFSGEKELQQTTPRKRRLSAGETPKT